MPDIHVVILAAGKGTRMKSALPKVLHQIAGKPMIEYVLRAAAPLQAATTTVVVGHGAPLVKAALASHPALQYAAQEPQLGTAHALLQAEASLGTSTGTLLLLSGDVPLLSRETLGRLVTGHHQSGAAATVLTARVERPYGYGRIVRARDRIARIVEEGDASPAERQIREINAGIYAFELESLFAAVHAIAAQNAQREYYLPDVISIYRRRQRRVETVTVENPIEIRGINSRSELAEVSSVVRTSKNEELMAAGVTLEDPATTYVDADVVVGPDTVIHPGVILEGQTRIGAACEIHSGARIVDSTLEDRVTVLNFCVIEGARIAEDAKIGPFAHLRGGSDVGQGAKVGNFVELKKTVIGAGSKASHLTYLGDTTVGERVNIGAGTITCNYDGEQKQQTIIEDEAFIGSDAQLIAPVKVGRGAYVGAGSSITTDVPAGALGIARGRQVNIEGWVAKKKGK